MPINWSIGNPNAAMDAVRAYNEGEEIAKRNALADLVIQKAQREQADDDAAREVYRKTGGDLNALQNMLMQQGLYKQALTIKDHQLNQQQLQGTIDKDKASAQKSQMDAAGAKQDAAGRAFAYVRQYPTPENANKAIDWLGSLGVYTPEEVAAHKAKIPNDPAAIAQMADLAWNAAVKPDTAYSAAAADARQQQQLAVQMRGQDMQAQNAAATRAAAETRAAATADRPVVLNDPNRPPMLVNRTTGEARPITGPGGTSLDSATSAKNAVAAQKVKDILAEIEKVLPQSTGSYLGFAADQVARAGGYGTSGAQAAAKLKILQAQLMMAQPRMEGPQSDKDVLLYREAAGLVADSTQPIVTRQAAIEQIKALNNKYLTPGEQHAAPTQQTAAPANPSGTDGQAGAQSKEKGSMTMAEVQAAAKEAKKPVEFMLKYIQDKGITVTP